MNQPEQFSLFDDPPQEIPAKTRPVAQDSPKAPASISKSPTPTAPYSESDESTRNERAHSGLEDYIAGRR